MPLKNPTMLLKYPGTMHKLQDGTYDGLIVEQEDVDAAVNDGWFRTKEEAKAAYKPPEAAKPEPVEPDDRELLLAEAEKLGLEVDGRWSDKTLIAKLKEARA